MLARQLRGKPLLLLVLPVPLVLLLLLMGLGLLLMLLARRQVLLLHQLTCLCRLVHLLVRSLLCLARRPLVLRLRGRVSHLVALEKLLPLLAYVSALRNFCPLGFAKLRPVSHLPLLLGLRGLHTFLPSLSARFKRGRHHQRRLVVVRLFPCRRSLVPMPVSLAVVSLARPLCPLHLLLVVRPRLLVCPLVCPLGLSLLPAAG